MTIYSRVSTVSYFKSFLCVVMSGGIRTDMKNLCPHKNRKFLK